MRSFRLELDFDRLGWLPPHARRLAEYCNGREVVEGMKILSPRQPGGVLRGHVGDPQMSAYLFRRSGEIRSRSFLEALNDFSLSFSAADPEIREASE